METHQHEQSNVVQKGDLTAVLLAKDEIIRAKDEHIKTLTAENEHLREHSKFNSKREVWVATFGFAVAKGWDIALWLLNAISRPNPGAFWTYIFVISYVVLSCYGLFWMIRRLYRTCRAAATISPTARYAAQLSTSVIVTLGFTMAFLSSSGPHQYSDHKTAIWPFLIGSACGVYNFLKMRGEAKRAGTPPPSLRQIAAWSNY